MDLPRQGSGFEGEDSGCHHGVQEPKPGTPGISDWTLGLGSII